MDDKSNSIIGSGFRQIGREGVLRKVGASAREAAFGRAALVLGHVDIRRRGAIIAPPFPISTPSFPRKREARSVARARAHNAFVRIRIHGIMGFSGFFRLVFDRQTLIRIRLGGISSYSEKRNPVESKILKNPANPLNSDSDKGALAVRRRRFFCGFLHLGRKRHS